MKLGNCVFVSHDRVRKIREAVDFRLDWLPIGGLERNAILFVFGITTGADVMGSKNVQMHKGTREPFRKERMVLGKPKSIHDDGRSA